VHAASELIIEVGWANVTTRQISERAGVNNALVHYHFGSKEDLLLEAAAAAFAVETEGPFSELADAASVRDALQGMLLWLRTIETDSPGMIVSMEAAHQAIRDDRVSGFLQGIWSEAFEVLASLIAHGQSTGELREDLDPHDAAVTLGALVDGLFLYRLVAPSFDIDGVAAVATVFIDSLAKGRRS